MIRKLALAVSAAMLLAPGATFAQESQSKIARNRDWNPAADEGRCQLRVWVDDTARIRLRGDDIWIETQRGERAYDQGSFCNQPLPFHGVQDFRVTAERGRGRIEDVNAPNRRNNFTGTLKVEDPQNGGSLHVINIAWRNPEGAYSGRRYGDDYVSNDRYPWFDEVRACQDQVRTEFLRRYTGDAYLEFVGVPEREDLGPGRDRVRGEAYARNRYITRQMNYECVVNDRTNTVENISYRFDAPTRGAMR